MNYSTTKFIKLNKFPRGIITHRECINPLHSLLNEVYELSVGMFSLIIE